MKPCKRCGQGKPLSEFPTLVKRGVSGPGYWCRDCMQQYQREWKKANPAMVRESKRRHRERHRDEIRESKREVYYRNLEQSREQQRLWRRMNPDRVAARSQLYASRRRWLQLLRDHGLTAEQFVQLWELQDGVCAICHRPLPNARLSQKEGPGTHVDHDHATGLVRGLLCGRCNIALGALEDKPERMARAIQYLAAPPARSLGAPGEPSIFPGKPWGWVPPKAEKTGPGSGARNLEKTHCPRGHAYDEQNTVVRGYARKCRTCERELSTEAYHRLHPDAPYRGPRPKERAPVVPGPGLGAFNREKTCCKEGHPFDAENTAVQGNGSRRCRACDRQRQAARFHRLHPDAPYRGPRA